MSRRTSEAGFFQIVSELFTKYRQETSQRVKLIDAFIVFNLLTAAVQFVYVLLVGTFPFNSFLAGFFTSISLMVFAASLRKQVNTKTSAEFETIVPERAFFDFIFCCILTFLIGLAYMG